MGPFLGMDNDWTMIEESGINDDLRELSTCVPPDQQFYL